MKDMNNVKITFLSALAWKYESFKKLIVAKLGRENKKKDLFMNLFRNQMYWNKWQ